MNERIKQLAEQAGFDWRNLNEIEKFIDLKYFAELIRAEEREACALVCVTKLQQTPYGNVVADAIRQRGEK